MPTQASIVPTAEDYDDMHHALGRIDYAADPMAKAYRNHYSVEADGDKAKRFEALGWWDRGRLINNGRDRMYHVNATGRAHLADWLRGRACA